MGPPAPRLVLTAFRHRASGAYLPYSRARRLARQFDVPIASAVAAWTPPPRLRARGGVADPEGALLAAVADIRAALDAASRRRGARCAGCVVSLPSGLVLKVCAAAAAPPPGIPMTDGIGAPMASQ